MFLPTSFVALATTCLIGLLLGEQVSTTGIYAEALGSKWTHLVSKADLEVSSSSSELLGTQTAYGRAIVTSGATASSIATITNTALSPDHFPTTVIDDSTVTSDAAALATSEVDTTKICPTTFTTSTRYNSPISARVIQEVIEVDVTTIGYTAPLLTFINIATISATTTIPIRITTTSFVSSQTSSVTSVGTASNSALATVYHRDLQSYQQDPTSQSSLANLSPVDNQPFSSQPRPEKSHDDIPPSQPKPTKSHTKHESPVLSQPKSTKSHSHHVATPSMLNPLPEDSSELQGRHHKISAIDTASTLSSKEGSKSSDAYHSNGFRCSEGGGEDCSRPERKKEIPRHPPDHSGSGNSTSSNEEGSSQGSNESKGNKGTKGSEGSGSKKGGSESEKGGSGSGSASKSGSGSESGGSESGSGT